MSQVRALAQTLIFPVLSLAYSCFSRRILNIFLYFFLYKNRSGAGFPCCTERVNEVTINLECCVLCSGYKIGKA